MSRSATAPFAEAKHPADVLELRSIQDAFEGTPEDLRRRMGWSCVPGDPQHAYRNIERAGFHTSYLRDNYAPQDNDESRPPRIL